MTEEEKYIEKANREIALEDYRSNIIEVSERLKFQVEFAQATLKNLHLANGGAIIALLTFFGHTASSFDFRSLWWAFVWFGLGLASSLAAYFGAFYSQLFFMNAAGLQAWNNQVRARGGAESREIGTDYARGNKSMYFGMAAATLSLLCFIIGAFVALNGLK